MNFATWAIRQPIPPVVLFLLATFAGLYGFSHIKIADMPDMELPMVIINAGMLGASPSQLETEVTRKIENAVASIDGIDEISSTVSEGMSTTMIQFKLEKNVFEALNDVRAQVSNLRQNLPPDLEEPIVSKVNSSSMPIQTISVYSSSMDEEALSWWVDNTVSRKLTGVPGVAAVNRQGGVTREVRVELDPVQLVALNVSAADVSRQLRRSQQQLSGGRAEIGDARQSLRTIATAASAEDLGVMDIVLPGGRHLRLDQIATIHDTVADRSQLSLLDGKPVVAFSIQRTKEASAIDVAEAVTIALDELRAQNPMVEYRVVNDFVKRIEHEYEASMLMVIEGSILALIVVFIFLRDWRATLVSSISLPLSIIPTFAFMYLMDFSLNTLTLLALSLVIGLLVDDTIVEVENIVRHLRAGKSPMRAAIDAAVEIGLAVVATTMTLVAVFLPTAFMSGISGMFFKQFGWTAVLAVLASLAVARLITPMICSRLLKAHSGPPEQGRILQTYLRMAHWSLLHPKTVVVGATTFFVLSVLGLGMLPQSFVPPQDSGRTRISVELTPGSTLEETLAVSERVRELVIQVAEVRSVFTSIGAGSSVSFSSRGGSSAIGATDLRKATLTVELAPAAERSRKQQEVEAEFREILKSMPGARFTIGFGYTGEKLQLNITGDDSHALSVASEQVMAELRKIGGIGNVTSSASLLRPEIIIRPDFAAAAELGVNAASIGETVQVATAGDYTAALAKLNLPERQVDIRVQLPFDSRKDLEPIRQLRVPGNNGLVPLSAVADVSIGSGPAQITRYERARNIQIDAELGKLQLGDLSKMVDALPVLQRLPAGVRKVDYGDAERMKEMMGAFGLAMITGIMCVFMVLVLLFKDFMQPVTILAALPLSIGGAVIALLIANQPFSMPAVIGVVMLMGITTKNSILLVEYAVVAMRDRGLSLHDAMLDACGKRARPIVMTTLAMAAGMMPVALGLDADTSFRSPLGIVVIGGLITSTGLSLIVVPVVFEYVVRLEKVLRRWLRIPDRKAYPELDEPMPGGTPASAA